MIESHPIPAIAKTALSLLSAQYQADCNRIGEQTVQALGLDPALDWRVDFGAGTITREIPDPPAKTETDASPVTV